MKKEIWKEVNELRGRYKVSNFGRIKRCKRVRGHTGYLLSPCLSDGGYFIVCLINNKGRYQRYYVHRLIGVAFLKNPDNKKFINHKNGVKNDNNVDNLEWVTFSENMKHAFAMGLYRNPGKPRFNRLEVLAMHEIYNLNPKWNTIMRFSKKYDVSPVVIYKMIKGETYKSALQT